jgi:hypothetical protein
MPTGLKVVATLLGLVVMVLAMSVSASRRTGTWQDWIDLRQGEYLFRGDGAPRRGYRLFVLLWFAIMLILLWLLP